jgi:putative hydrolase of the HAD superfamily
MTDTSLAGALLIDFGGVLTSSVTDGFAAYERSVGLPDGGFFALVGEDAEANRLFVAFEEGRIEEDAFQTGLAARIAERHGLAVDPTGIVRGLTGSLVPDQDMIDVLGHIRLLGVPVAIVSNSFGYGAYNGYDIDGLADEVVISGLVGVRKPSRRIYEIAAERLAVEPAGCVFVDDLELNLSGARRLGMEAFHHTDTALTLEFLAERFGL